MVLGIRITPYLRSIRAGADALPLPSGLAAHDEAAVGRDGGQNHAQIAAHREIRRLYGELPRQERGPHCLRRLEANNGRIDLLVRVALITTWATMPTGEQEGEHTLERVGRLEGVRVRSTSPSRRATNGKLCHGRKSSRYRYRYYTCFSCQRYGASGCSAERLPGDELDAAVLEALLDTYGDHDLFERAVRAATDRAGVLRAEHEEACTSSRPR